MAIYLRCLSHRPCTVLASFSLVTKKTAPFLHQMSFIKTQIPTSLFGRCSIQQRSLHPLAQKALYVLTGMRPLSADEKKQLLGKHQKLWVAHFSIHDHIATEHHWEKFYAMQLADDPKDFSTQKYYLDLLEKKKTDLTPDEVQDMVDLYLLALEQSQDPITRWGLKRKLAEYQALQKPSS